MHTLPQAFYLETLQGQLFCLYHPPHGPFRGRVLHLHPLAEELNNSRRVSAQQARALAQMGYAVLQFDMLGCGDSTGEFGDATWTQWLMDAHTAATWLLAQGSGPLWLWGSRTGALLANDLLAQWDHTAARPPQTSVHLLFWQAVLSGQQALKHWSRLRSATSWTGGTDRPSSVFMSLQENPSPSSVPWSVAGYTFSTGLQEELGQSTLQPPSAQPGQRLVWIDVSTTTPPTNSPGALRALEAWRQAGWEVFCTATPGPSYWQTIGTEDAPDLQSATLAFLNHGD